MVDHLESADRLLFRWLNLAGNPFWDTFMYLISTKTFWVPFYMIILVIALRSNGWKSMVGLLISVLIAVGLSDFTTSGILKPLVERYRPCRPEADLSFIVHTVKDKCGGYYGFASSHAANFFAMATFLRKYYQRRYWSWIFPLIAGLVAYSRVYMGVHYPGDVIAGGLIGTIWSLAVYWVYVRVPRIWKKIP